MSRVYVILLDRATADEREAVQAIVKDEAQKWWHRFQDVWLATGHSAPEWRELLKPVLGSPTSNLLVFSLPSDPTDRDWSYWGTQADERTAWIKRNFPRGGPKPE